MLNRAASYGLKPGDIRRATSAMVGASPSAHFSRSRRCSTWLSGVALKLRANIDDVRNLMIIGEDGSQAASFRSRTSASRATSSFGARGPRAVSMFSAKVDERALGDVADDVARSVKQKHFHSSNRAEVLGEYKEQRAALRTIYSYIAAAAC